MYTASFADVLQVLFVILLVYYGVKIFFRLFGPAILRYFMKRIGRKFEKSFNQKTGFSSEEKRKEGETIIDKQPVGKKRSKKETGEYIDYEEID